MSTIYKQIEQYQLMPVVKLERVEDAVPLAQALCDGGLACAEITFRTAVAAETIAAITKAFPHMLIGAGTILTTEQADAAIAAGAAFLVSPGLNPDVVSYCQSKGYPILPGVCTPSEIEKALAMGLTYLKFFPAEAAGGTAMLKALSAPYAMVRWMPTGGVSLQNLRSYLDLPSVFACGGSWMVADKWIKAGDFATITKLTAEAAALRITE